MGRQLRYLGIVALLEVLLISLKLSAAEVADALIVTGQAAPAGLGSLVAGGVVVAVVGVGARVAKGVPYKLIPIASGFTSKPSPKTRFLNIFNI